MADEETKKKPSRREVMYDRGKDKKSSSASSDKKPDAKAAAEKPAEGEAPASPMEGFVGEMDSLNKRHEAERRDHHGNTREAMRKMATRHAQDFKDLAQRQADAMAKMSPPAEMPAAAGEAPGGATQVAEGAAPAVA